MQKEDIERLYGEHHQRMHRLARMLLLDEAEAQDVVSDVFERLCSLSDAKEVDASYLLAAVRNGCANVLKHRGIQRRVHQQYAEDARKQPLHADENDRTEQLRRFVRTGLSPRLQEVFRLRFGDELKYREIAERLNVSEVMVYKYLSQIIQTIQTHFKTLQR